MNEMKPVLVIGAAALDTKGSATHSIRTGQSNPGLIRISEGGVARNIAENLSRLGVATTLISAVGDDGSGQRILRQAEESSTDVGQVLVVRGGNTSAYVALYDDAGAPIISLYDMSILSRITPAYIFNRRRLVRDAGMIVIDANLSPATLETVFKLAGQFDVPVCADPTSTSLAERLVPYLNTLYMITPDRSEAETLTGVTISNRGDAIEAAKRLVSQGVDIAIVKLSDQGACYATASVAGHIPAVATDVVDLTGVGDALTATAVFGLLNNFSVDEAVRLGASAASLTLQCRETVCPTLSLERLYDNLVI